MPSTDGSNRFRSASERERREAYWRKTLAEASTSGQTQAAFCRARGIELATFHWWKAEIARRDAGNRLSRTMSLQPSVSVSLVPVRLTHERTNRPADGGDSQIEIILRGGRIVHVGPAFDEQALRRVIAILEETC